MNKTPKILLLIVLVALLTAGGCRYCQDQRPRQADSQL